MSETATAPLRLGDIATRISAHLARLDADKDANPVTNSGFRRFHRPRSWLGGPYVRVCYVSYNRATTLTRAEAEHYLAALDSGFTERHDRLPKEPA